MNAASQLFRALAIIGAIAAGALFYMTNGKTAELTNQLGKAKSELADAQAKTGGDLKTAQDTLATTAADLDKSKKELKKALDDEDLATKRLQGAVDALDASEKASKAKDAKVAEMAAQVSDLRPKADSVDDLNKQISTLRTQLAESQTAVEEMRNKAPKPANAAGSTSTSTTGTPTAVAATPVQLSSAASAKVLQASTTSWILILDAGSDSALQKDVNIYLKIGSTPVGSAVVVSNDGKLVTCNITGTDILSAKAFAGLVKAGASVDYQRAL